MQYLSFFSGSRLSLVAIVLYLAYFLSSVPRYTRQVRQQDRAVQANIKSVASQTLQSIKTYALEPNRKLWQNYSEAIGNGWAGLQHQSYFTYQPIGEFTAKASIGKFFGVLSRGLFIK